MDADWLPFALTDYQLWLLAGIVLAIAEALIPGVYLIWIGAAAILTGIVTFIFGPVLAIQFGIFAVLVLLSVLLGYRIYRRNPITSADPMLNQRAQQMVGRTVVVSTAIINGEGRVKVGDGSWRAIGPDAPIGTRMTVTAASGTQLTVDYPAA